MNMTLLDMVQDILSDMSGDSVNSIGDTEEALQIAQIIKSTYNEMMTRREWPHLKKLVQLSSYSDNRFPTHLLLPSNTRRVEWITYNQRKADNPNNSFSPIRFLESGKFIQFTNSRAIDGPGTQIVTTHENVPIKILNNTPPTYWTTFDDKLIVMDSYDSAIEDTLQGSQSQCEAYIYPSWQTQDDFVPNIPGHLFPGFLAESKSTCFYILKKMPNEKAEQQSRRQSNKMSMQGWRLNGGINYPNYGRRR
jgi:hypothetical protein